MAVFSWRQGIDERYAGERRGSPIENCDGLMQLPGRERRVSRLRCRLPVLRRRPMVALRYARPYIAANSQNLPVITYERREFSRSSTVGRFD
jgi:hypothetical protein